MMKLGMGAFCLALAFLQPNAYGQVAATSDTRVPDANLPVYDAVVIKPNGSGGGSSRLDSNIDLYNATNVSLKTLLQDAYDVKPDMISGIPKAMESTHFDIQAKVIEPDINVLKKLNSDQRRAMRRGILLDRFQLKVHTEERTLPVFEMSLAKDGPKFKASTSTGNGSSTHTHSIPHGTELNARNVTMAAFASTLYGEAHRTVLDKTGLTGRYDIDMKWSPDDAATPDPDAGPSVFTALEEQLGLKLRAAKGPVQTLVVDHVEMPSEN